MPASTLHPVLVTVLRTLCAADDDAPIDHADPLDEWTISTADLVRVFEAGHRCAVAALPSSVLDLERCAHFRAIALEAAEYMQQSADEVRLSHPNVAGEWWGTELQPRFEYDRCVALAAELRVIADTLRGTGASGEGLPPAVPS